MSKDSILAVEQRLGCNGRQRLKRTEFLENDWLYVSFRKSNIDASENIKPELFRLPDCSCNWSRFSEPADVRIRENGKLTDGCLAMHVRDVNYDQYAVPVHDPLCGSLPENYSHCEIRIIPDGMAIDEEPPKNAKKRTSKTEKAKRNAWRKHVILNSKILIQAEA